jgi:hypothetical protein
MNWHWYATMKKEYKNGKRVTLYSLQKLTNSVVKWTAIISSCCKEFSS